MTARYDAIDLSTLPAPSAVETLDYESWLTQVKADFVARCAAEGIDYDVDALTSDPIVKLLEVFAYRELVLRSRVNDAVKATLLAFSYDTNLDQLGAYYKTTRRLIDPGDPEAIPPVEPTYESDGEFRARLQLAPEALSTAGSRQAYEFFALGASGAIKSVQVWTPSPGQVHVLPLIRTGDGIPGDDVLDAVKLALDPDYRVPLTDQRIVRAPTRIDYTIAASIQIAGGPAPAGVLAEANAALDAYLLSRHKVGKTVYRNGIIAALKVGAAENVVLSEPAADVAVAWDQVAWATSRTVTTTTL